MATATERGASVHPYQKVTSHLGLYQAYIHVNLTAPVHGTPHTSGSQNQSTTTPKWPYD